MLTLDGLALVYRPGIEFRVTFSLLTLHYKFLLSFMGLKLIFQSQNLEALKTQGSLFLRILIFFFLAPRELRDLT